MGAKIGNKMVKRYARRCVGRWAKWRRKPAEGAKIGKMAKPVGSPIYMVELVNAEAAKW